MHFKYESSFSPLFDPSGKGRPMKDWLQIPLEHEAYNRTTEDL